MAGAWLQAQSSNLDTNVGQQIKVVSSESRLISRIAREVGPSVVSVNVTVETAAQEFDDPFGLFGTSQPRAVRGAGTGIIVDAKGIVMTNRHVVPTGTTKVSITLSDGTELKDVSVIGRTNESDSLDIAFLKINDLKGKRLLAATIGRSSSLQVGDNVVAIGNALGQFQNTVTSGIISGFGRSVLAGDSSQAASTAESLVDLLQTDAAINQGNSGGPLVNLSGQVIGINTAIAGEGAQNIGFAIPIDNVRGMITQILKSGKFARPYLGVRYIPLTPEVASELELSVDHGAYITPSVDSLNSSVLANGPAAKAGLHERDIITHVDNTKIDQRHSLTGLLGAHQPGERVKLNVLRDGKTIYVNVTLGTLPSNE
jgi:serine protease Do